MGSMKELITAKADEISLAKYNKEYCELSVEWQDKVWRLAEQAGQDWLVALINAERERRKYEQS